MCSLMICTLTKIEYTVKQCMVVGDFDKTILNFITDFCVFSLCMHIVIYCFLLRKREK